MPVILLQRAVTLHVSVGLSWCRISLTELSRLTSSREGMKL